MNKKPAQLPNIEDATLKACLAPLVDAMNAGLEMNVRADATGRGRSMRSGDHTAPSNEAIPARDPSRASGAAVRRSAREEDFGVLRTVELFLAMTEAELDQVVAMFPRQIGGTFARILRIKRCLAARYDQATAAAVLLERALARAGVPHEDRGSSGGDRSTP